MSQGIDGVQTVYTYEAATEYGALHKVTKTVQANGKHRSRTKHTKRGIHR